MKLITKLLLGTSIVVLTFILSGCANNAALILLTNTSDEQAGTNCIYGGTKVDVGWDGNRNGILEDSEIGRTSYTCDESDEDDGSYDLTSLINTSDENPGTNCIYGGTKIDVGLDDNGNDILEDSEIDSTSYICVESAAPGSEEHCLIEAGGYGTIVVNHRTWLDRNLGASKVADSMDDNASYGDLYQWGRGADGHEERNSTITTTSK